MRSSDLSREDWMRAARLALHERGPDAVRVEPLAAALGVTKGSFYWHFADRAALLDALVTEWEEELDLALAELASHEGADAFRRLLAFVEPRVQASLRGDVPSDAAMLAWAATDAAVAKRVNAAERQRIALIQRVVGNKEIGEYIYLAYIGFLTRRRRVPASNAFLASFTGISEQLALDVKGRRREVDSSHSPCASEGTDGSSPLDRHSEQRQPLAP